jgi:hypothetical protein
MKYDTNIIVYPEGDTQEIDWQLRFHQIVDVSGRPLQLPVATARMLAYLVYRVSNEETRNEHIRRHYLEQLYPEELAEHARER